MTPPEHDDEPTAIFQRGEPFPVSVLATSSWPGLSARQAEVAELLALGSPARVIADRLGISKKTVDSHRGHILSILGLSGTVALTRYAIRWGYVSKEESPYERRSEKEGDEP